ncbi:MAG: TRAP transporter substrate-binding protein [Paracoccus sp. (in: a-proteobacteria)]|nr:TRAP transporter substrate-binding protein [Paracoccus sp. (in: a-proteobacteria)]
MKTIKTALMAAAAFALPAGAAFSDTTLRLAYWVPATIAPASAGIIPWAESVTEASDGRIQFQLYPAQQLGAAPDHYDMARDGISDISWVNPGYTAGRFPIFALTEVPFQVSDSIDGVRAIHEWYMQYAEEEMPDVKVCVFHPHAPGALHSKAPMNTPEDVRGRAIRPAHATMARFISQLGGSPIQVPAPEAREAIARGTADAVTFPWGSMYDFSLYDETKYHLDMPFYMSVQTLVINKDAYNGLSDEDRAVIDDHCTPEWSARMAEGWHADDMAARDRLIEDGTHTFHEPSEDEVQAWRDAAEGVLNAWREDVSGRGSDADAIYDSYTEHLEAHGARY